MKAIEISQPGGPDVLRLCERPEPSVGPHDVLIRVAAASVNRPDVQQRKGLYDPPPGASDIPGLDTAGIVERVGAAVERIRPGDRVCALSTGGGYAELCAVPQGQVMPVPAGLSLTEAATLPEVFFTAWHNVFQLSRLERNEALLIQGGTSGVGLAATQMARVLRHARVFATAGSAEKCSVSEAYGAQCVDYHDPAWGQALRDLAGERGFDVILDSQAGDYVDIEVGLLAIGGRLALIGNHRGEYSTLRTRSFVQRSLTLTGAQIRRRDTAFKQKIANELVQYVWPELAQRRIRTLVQAAFPLEQAAAAQQILDDNQQMGKVVLIVDRAIA
ncbi:NAD(P)H-quinone oxidoreductase [Candidimonas nitroreducens]|uniref:NAD(P)H-quinone oxidoreductase n=1 Tax=Candidimonas nitroreducens TaxID=683354 RepID=A0A225M5I1_9BURK|nr:NAD(P)H-quinone oxidoreductase [Candidimonas nitroreducens]OWT54811.1 NAD(P)H-quinone oxidoreductase [Candidimonas nitroreducens]